MTSLLDAGVALSADSLARKKAAPRVAGLRSKRAQLVLGSALSGVAALALLHTPAHAVDECGPPSGGAVVCTPEGNPYPNGISYPAQPADLTVSTTPGVIVNTATANGASVSGTGGASVTFDGTGSSISTYGAGSAGILVQSQDGNATAIGDVVSTYGSGAPGVVAFANNGTAAATAITSVNTTGAGVAALGYDGATATATGPVTTSGDGILSVGVAAVAGPGTATVTAGDVTTQGAGTPAVAAIGTNASVTDTGLISTSGAGSFGVVAIANGGYADVTVQDLTTTGDGSTGIVATATNSGPVLTAAAVAPGDLAAGDVLVTVNGNLTTGGINADGVDASAANGTANVALNGSVTTYGTGSKGVYATGGSFNVGGGGNVTTYGDNAPGVYARGSSGTGSVTVGNVSTFGASSIGIDATSADNLDVTAGSVTTLGDNSDGILAQSNFGNVSVVSTGTVSTGSAEYYTGANSIGIRAQALNGTASVTANNVRTVGVNAPAISVTALGDATASSSGTVSTSGSNSAGVSVTSNYGIATATVNNAITTGDYSSAVVAQETGYGLLPQAMALAAPAAPVDPAALQPGDSIATVNGSVTTSGVRSYGAQSVSNNGTAYVVNNGSINTSGYGARGVVANGNAGVDISGSGSITTTGANADAVHARSNGTGNVSVGTIRTSGYGSDGVDAAANGNLTVTSTDTRVTNGNSSAIYAQSYGGNLIVNSGIASSYDAPAIYANAYNGTTTVNITGATTTTYGDTVLVNGSNGSTVNISSTGSVTGGIGGYAIDATGGPATVTNAGAITGAISLTNNADTVTNSGTFNATGDSQFGGGTDSFTNTGTLNIRPGASTPGAVTFASVDQFNNNGGLVSLINGHVADQFTIDGAYEGNAGRVGLDLTLGSTTPAGDLLVANGTITGSSAVTLNNVSPVAPVLLGTTGLVIARGAAGSSTTALTVAPGSLNQGFITYAIVAGSSGVPGDTSVVYRLLGLPGQGVYQGLKISEAAQNLWYRSADAVSSHQHSVRDALWAGSTPGGGGLWLQMYGGVDKRQSRQGFTNFGIAQSYDLSYRQDYFGGQAGYELGHVADTGGVLFGVTGGYISSHVNFAGSPNRVNIDAYNAGAYASFMSGGLFVNLLGKYDFYKLDARERSAGFEDNFHGHSYGAQGEAGYRFGSDGFFAEPMVTFAVVRTNLRNLVGANAVIDFDTMKGARGKAGLRVGGSHMMGGSKVVFYASGNYVKEFDGKNGLTFNSGAFSPSFTNRRIGAYAQTAVGLNVASSNGMSGFFEANGDFSNNYKGGGVRVGLNIKF